MVKHLLTKKVSFFVYLCGFAVIMLSTGSVQAQDNQTDGRKITGTISTVKMA